jgi:hypothetical protein
LVVVFNGKRFGGDGGPCEPKVECVTRVRQRVMRTGIRKTLVVAFYGFLAAMVVCFAVAMHFQTRKHELSGVPVNHYVVSENGQQFSVPRLGDSSGQRPRVLITPTQYEFWEENQASKAST